MNESGEEEHYFKEKYRFVQFIANLNSIPPDPYEFEQLLLVLDKYQDQPQALDSSLEELVAPMISRIMLCIKSEFCIDKVLELNSLFIILYRLTKTRGYKIVLKHFTHEVQDLEPSLLFFKQISKCERMSGFWEMRFIMLIWLSLISMIPFDLSTIDSSQDASLIDKMLDIARDYLDCVGKEYQGACIMATRLLTRKDVATSHLLPFIEWQVSMIASTNDTFKIRGHLSCLCGIYKIGQRDSLLKSLGCAVQLTELQSKPIIQNNSLLRKLFTKVTTRIGLCFLKARVCTWRYSRGPRILENNLLPRKLSTDIDIKHDANSFVGIQASSGRSENNIIDIKEQFEEVPDEIESVVEILLTNLSDCDTVVRWTAAKGIGRLCNRLSLEYADQIVTCVIDLLKDQVGPFKAGSHDQTLVVAQIGALKYADISCTSEKTWHGACLALAELIRRGLLLPVRLYDVAPLLLRALSYELMRGSYSLGSNVRDSACYAVWSIARSQVLIRAYDPSIIEPFANELATELVLVSLTDREITVRRAASAAFQENVGRHGLFSHGIDIIVMADYFSLGIRANCFADVMIRIAQYEVYRMPIFVHLLKSCASHWDKNTRILASQSFGILAELYCIQPTIEIALTLIKNLKLSEGYLHGGLLCVGEIVLGLSRSSAFDWNKSCLIQPLEEIIAFMIAEFGQGGTELVRQAGCHFIECCAKSDMLKYTMSLDVVDTWLKWLHDTLARDEESLHTYASIALGHLLNCSQCTLSSIQMQYYLNQVGVNSNRHCRRGFAVAIGHFPNQTIKANLETIFKTLINATKVQVITFNERDDCFNDAESRRNSMNALNNLMAKMISANYTIKSEISNDMYLCYLSGMEDHSVDSRGDVGSWVRRSSVLGFELLLSFAHKTGFNLEIEKVTEIIGYILLSCAEKIDRVRETAGLVIMRILNDVNIPEIPEKDALLLILCSGTEPINWLVPKNVYPIIVQLLRIARYRDKVLTGIMISIGGLTESLVRNASESLIDFLTDKSTNSTPIFEILESMNAIFKLNLSVERITMPILETLDLLIDTGLMFSSVAIQIRGIFECVKLEILKSRNTRKLILTIKVYAGFALLPVDMREFTKVRQVSMEKLILYLAHPFLIVRSTAAEALYMIVSSGQLEDLENIDDAEGILLETNWDSPIEQCKKLRSQVKSIIMNPQ